MFARIMKTVKKSMVVRFRRCKFGTFCSYSHILNTEEKIKAEAEILKRDVSSLKDRNRKLLSEICATIEDAVTPENHINIYIWHWKH